LLGMQKQILGLHEAISDMLLRFSEEAESPKPTEAAVNRKLVEMALRADDLLVQPTRSANQAIADGGVRFRFDASRRQLIFSLPNALWAQVPVEASPSTRIRTLLSLLPKGYWIQYP